MLKKQTKQNKHAQEKCDLECKMYLDESKRQENAYKPAKEKEIQYTITQYLEYQKNLYFIRTNSFAGAFMRRDGSSGYIKNNKAGCPDIIVLKDGRFIGLEVKTDKGKQSDLQKEAEEKIERCGGEYYIVRNLEDVVEILK